MAADLFSDRVNFWNNIPHRGKVQVNPEASRPRDEL